MALTTHSYHDVMIRDINHTKNTYSLMLGEEAWDENGEIFHNYDNKMTHLLQHLELTEKDYIAHNFVNNGYRKFTIIVYHCQLTEYKCIDHFLMSAEPVVCFLR